MIDKVLKFLDDGIPKNDFDRQLLASNLVGATNLIELNKKERIITLQAAKKLELNPIKGNFDYQHLKDIHKALFEDVYNKQINLIYFKEYNLYKLLKFYFKSK